MLRNWSKAVPEGSGPVRHDEVGLDQPTLADLCQMIEEMFDRKLKIMEGHFQEDSQAHGGRRCSRKSDKRG